MLIMKTLLLLMLLLQLPDFDDAVLSLSGASCIEELSEESLDFYRELNEHPLYLNRVSLSRLRSCGLFSAYQAASIDDYRRRSGDILSFNELAFVDGIGKTMAEALRHFVSLDSDVAPGTSRGKDLECSITASSALSLLPKTDLDYPSPPDMRNKCGFKMDLQYAERSSLKWNMRSSFSEKMSFPGTLSICHYSRRLPIKFIAGHFNARFGQGLVSWTGFRLKSFSSISAFSLSGSGLSPTSAAGAEMCGLASSASLGKTEINLGWSYLSKELIFNVNHNSKSLSCGITANLESASADFRWSLPSLAVFGEYAIHFSKGPAAVTGAIWTPKYGLSLALTGRYYATSHCEYSGIAVGIGTNALMSSIDFSKNEYKGKKKMKYLLEWKSPSPLGNSGLTPKARLSVSGSFPDQKKIKTELRLDLNYSKAPFQLNVRADASYMEHLGLLGYCEAAYISKPLKTYLKFILFDIKDWDGRIYCYERNAPGNFTIPAYYGKGYAVSSYSAISLGSAHGIWFRASWTACSRDSIKRKSELQFSLQYRYKLSTRRFRKPKEQSEIPFQKAA